MTVTDPDTVSFSDLSRRPEDMAARAARLGRVRVTHRDSADFYLIAAAKEDSRDQSLTTASRLFLALMRHDPAARTLLLAMPDRLARHRPHQGRPGRLPRGAAADHRRLRHRGRRRVTPKRGDRVTVPAPDGLWEIRFATTDAVRGWEELCRLALANTRRCFDDLRAGPDPGGRLSGQYSTGGVRP